MARTGTADRSAGTAVRERIAGGNAAPGAARELVSGLLDPSTPESKVHDALLLVTELVTNAVRHAHVGERGTLEVDVIVTRTAVRVAVIDPGGEDTPRVQE